MPINGTNANDNLLGTALADVINAGNGNDIVAAGDGDDTVDAGNGNDTVDGGIGDDVVSGGNGNDTLLGGEGSDTLSGGNGEDQLNGGEGDDTLSGGNGNDVMNGGAGNDHLFGGTGNDVAVYVASENVGSTDVYEGGTGQDTLRLELTTAQWAQSDIRGGILDFLDRIEHGNTSPFHFAGMDLTAGSFEKLELIVDGVAVDPHAPVEPTLPDSADLDVLVIHADGVGGWLQGLQNQGFHAVDTFDSRGGTPTLDFLDDYDAILNFTNFIPSDGGALGNVLKDYVDQGGGLVLSTYGFSSPWDVSGGIMTDGYSPFENVLNNGDVSGNIVSTNPSDIVFDGVDLSQVNGQFSHNGNYSHPQLDAGAELLATDGNGENMIARNATGSVIAMNVWPGAEDASEAQLWHLFSNALADVSDAA